MKALKKPETQCTYLDRVRDDFRYSEQESITTISQNILSSLTRSAAHVLPRKLKVKINEVWKDDDEFNNLISLRSTLERNSDRHKSLTKQIKKRIRYLRNQQLQKKADEIDIRSQE